MPMFEYQCRECGTRFETFVTASRTPSCPTCEGDRLVKLVSTIGRIGGARGFGFGGG